MPRHKTHEECTLWFCDEPHYARGYCVRHYRNLSRNNVPMHVSLDLEPILLKFDEAQDLLNEFITDNWYSVLYSERDPNYKAEVKCNYCDSYAYAKDDIVHEEDCPVLSAMGLLVETEYFNGGEEE